MRAPIVPADGPQGVRERILAAAREHFAARGQQAASVRVIAEQAGVTAAMINYYFGGKAALHDAVVEEAQGRLVLRLSAALQGPPGDGGSLAPAVAAAYFDFLADDRDLQRILLRDVLDGGARAGELSRQLVQPLRDLLTRHFGDDQEVLHLAVSLFGAVAGYFIYAPLLPELLGDDPLGGDRLAARRRHVVELAKALSDARRTPDTPRKEP